MSDQQNNRVRPVLEHTQRETAGVATLLDSVHVDTVHANPPIGLSFIDRDMRIVRLDATLAAVNGASVEDHLGELLSDVIPDIWPQVEPPCRHVLDLGEPIVDRQITGRIAGDAGRPHHWLASYYPVPIDGDVMGVGVAVVDITERKEAEEFRAVVVMDNMAEGLYTLDALGRVTYLNAAASQLLGWTNDELHGKPMHDIVHFQQHDGAGIPAEDCPLLKIRTQGQTIRVVDEAFTRKDGAIFPVAYSSAPLLSGTTIQGVVVVFRDVSEEKKEQSSVRHQLDALSWIGRIRAAIDEDRLVLHSQPIVPLAEGPPGEELLLRMIGPSGELTLREELLLRMIGPSGELILPGSFLAVAETYGLIGEIDRWVISQAVRRAATGRRVIELNISAASIGTPDLLPFIKRQLQHASADPRNLVFEVTETALTRDTAAGEAFARGLAAIGCGLALDDFGTGFGGFTLLKNLPISYLKIDVEFVRGLATTPANLHIVRAIVSLARGFGLRTIAEGIEDEDTLTLLRAEGVDFGQGFHLGRPAST